MLFAGVPVTDHNAAVTWYERFFGRPAAFQATETESVWELTGDCWVYVDERAAHAGHAMNTVLVEDLDATVSGIAERGIQPSKREHFDNGVRKAIYHDPDGNEFGYGEVPQRA